MLFTETLFVFWWLLALVLYDRLEERNFDLKSAVLLGLALGLCMLTRQIGAILVAAILIYIAFIRYETAWRIRWKAATGIVAACLLVITPWMTRNALAVGAFTLNTNGGINMFIGFNPKAHGGYKFDPDQEAMLPQGSTEGKVPNLSRLPAWNILMTVRPMQSNLLPRKFAFLWSTRRNHPDRSFCAEGPPHVQERLRSIPYGCS